MKVVESRSASREILPKTYEGIWRRGEEYTLRNKVMLLEHDERGARAVAQGMDKYEVALRFVGTGLSRRCTCPYFEGRSAQHPPCKHIVATALIWDRERGIKLPSKDEVIEATIPPPLVSKNDIATMYRDPLHADLEILRMAVEAGMYVKPHARLPSFPHIASKDSEALSLAEAKRALLEMERWAARESFEPYFCAGEMMAAFCELLRLARKRLLVTPLSVSVDNLLFFQAWNKKLVLNLIDDSDGLHDFSEAHLEDLYQNIVARASYVGDEATFRAKLDEYVVSRGAY
ncbi:MAG: hypothetical protein COV07_04535 [Candidatus Vogelbacteria bacterium CG10_big_fil_rev_8_21_14_0_10_45_14]|uniref:SWIM-type domain-containing protein n=1 Tax=Candidatus Vogelbacteria bacterium CG10_big_fil_rev_8_21_14_0_10_45_14 TaxID=1975042 RepID=A0A2H0RKA3_9BACT|nr:MAG: hypothetical protein COV07_04535 [Candidatus Vogelbacteria bacterium CG10_big_fil_rev_8_21_14_0_10_45_14]